MALLAFASTVSGITTITNPSENCHRNGTNYVCVVSATTTLTLLPAGQHNTLLIRDEHGLVVATLDLQLASLTLDCLAKTDAWLRSYRIETLTVKRCPRAGSCFGDHCTQVLPSSSVPELHTVQNFPGHSHCSESNPFWGTECGLPSSACLYFRNFARPTSSDVYELFSCPGLSTRIVANLILETNNGQRQSTQITLHPGIPKKWGNITLTPLSISLPPLPVLNNQFIADGQSVAITNNLPLDLQCPTAEDAASLNCSLSLESCQSCVPDHSVGTMDCLCRDLDLDQMMDNPDLRLPLEIAKIHIRSEGTLLYAQHEYSPVQLAISIHELTLALESKDSKCWITPHKLVGCYRCSTGAQFSFTCLSNAHSPLAKVECDDGTLFVAHCSPNRTDNVIVLPFPHSDISTKCKVDCSSGETTFHLNGTLYFVPLRRQTAHQSRISDNGIPPPEGIRSWYNPFGDFIWFANNWIWLLAVILSSIAALYIFIILNPIFRTYRLLLRLAGVPLLLPFASAQDPVISPPISDGFLALAAASLLLLTFCLFQQYRHRIRQIAMANRLPF